MLKLGYFNFNTNKLYIFAKRNRMTTKEKVEQFLREFKTKKQFFDIIFRDERGKNSAALAELEITPIQREEVLDKLICEDYSEGPLEDTLYGIADLWVFGKTVKSKEVYIKISLGLKNNRVICISFHIAEHPMNYPFKNK